MSGLPSTSHRGSRRLGPWLLGVGAVITLLGSSVAEVGLLLAFFSTPSHQAAWLVAGGAVLVATGVVLMMAGKRLREPTRSRG